MSKTLYRKKLYPINNTQWALKSGEKKRILLDHIYGVDIDQQAVEMTKLSLLLKVLEGESSETLTKQLDLFKQRALPDLDNNIQCGNSLIAADYYDNIQLNLMSEEEIYQVNVFNWEEGFPNIMKQGGFDIVIGNPPWGASFKASELSYTALWITVRDSRILSLPYLPFPSCPRWMSKTLYKKET